jgi:hypothetical protein
MARQQGGCIRPFERETDDSVAILEAGLEKFKRRTAKE